MPYGGLNISSLILRIQKLKKMKKLLSFAERVLQSSSPSSSSSSTWDDGKYADNISNIDNVNNSIDDASFSSSVSSSSLVGAVSRHPHQSASRRDSNRVRVAYVRPRSGMMEFDHYEYYSEDEDPSFTDPIPTPMVRVMDGSFDPVDAEMYECMLHHETMFLQGLNAQNVSVSASLNASFVSAAVYAANNGVMDTSVEESTELLICADSDPANNTNRSGIYHSSNSVTSVDINVGNTPIKRKFNEVERTMRSDVAHSDAVGFLSPIAKIPSISSRLSSSQEGQSHLLADIYAGVNNTEDSFVDPDSPLLSCNELATIGSLDHLQALHNNDLYNDTIDEEESVRDPVRDGINNEAVNTTILNNSTQAAAAVDSLVEACASYGMDLVCTAMDPTADQPLDAEQRLECSGNCSTMIGVALTSSQPSQHTLVAQPRTNVSTASPLPGIRPSPPSTSVSSSHRNLLASPLSSTGPLMQTQYFMYEDSLTQQTQPSSHSSLSPTQLYRANTLANATSIYTDNSHVHTSNTTSSNTGHNAVRASSVPVRADASCPATAVVVDNLVPKFDIYAHLNDSCSNDSMTDSQEDAATATTRCVVEPTTNATTANTQPKAIASILVAADPTPTPPATIVVVDKDPLRLSTWPARIWERVHIPLSLPSPESIQAHSHGCIVYWLTSCLRVQENLALASAVALAKKLTLPIIIMVRIEGLL
jgi:hypothetical protein